MFLQRKKSKFKSRPNIKGARKLTKTRRLWCPWCGGKKQVEWHEMFLMFTMEEGTVVEVYCCYNCGYEEIHESTMDEKDKKDEKE